MKAITRDAPWKAEVTVGDTTVAEETIVNWYNEVYEPAYTAW